MAESGEEMQSALDVLIRLPFPARLGEKKGSRAPLQGILTQVAVHRPVEKAPRLVVGDWTRWRRGQGLGTGVWHGLQRELARTRRNGKKREKVFMGADN